MVSTYLRRPPIGRCHSHRSPASVVEDSTSARVSGRIASRLEMAKPTASGLLEGEVTASGKAKFFEIWEPRIGHQAADRARKQALAGAYVGLGTPAWVIVLALVPPRSRATLFLLYGAFAIVGIGLMFWHGHQKNRALSERFGVEVRAFGAPSIGLRSTEVSRYEAWCAAYHLSPFI